MQIGYNCYSRNQKKNSQNALLFRVVLALNSIAFDYNLTGERFRAWPPLGALINYAQRCLLDALLHAHVLLHAISHLHLLGSRLGPLSLVAVSQLWLLFPTLVPSLWCW